MVISKMAAKMAAVTLKPAYISLTIYSKLVVKSLGILETHLSVLDQSSYTDDVI